MAAVMHSSVGKRLLQAPLSYAHLGQRLARVCLCKVMAGFWPVVCDSGSEALTKHNALTNVAPVLPVVTEASREPWLKHSGKNQANGATTFLRGIKLGKTFKSCTTIHSKISEQMFYFSLEITFCFDIY